jgi:uncharacterized OsmC-like protein
MTSVHQFTVKVEQIDGFEFVVAFDKPTHAKVHMDEPAPLGRDSAPNAARYLAAAIGNCLAASLVFCLKKAQSPAPRVTASIDMQIVRTDAKRLRVGKVVVTLETALSVDDPALASCRETFEDFCIVTQSVRSGIDVEVHLRPAPSAP